MSEKNSARAGFGVMLLKDGQVLLGHRHEDPAKADSQLNGAGTWTMPGGKLDFGEEFEEAAYREVLEETGIKIDKSKLKLISVANNMVATAHFVTLGWLCEEFEGESEVREPDEITEWKWFDLDKLPEPMYFPSERVLASYQSGKIHLRFNKQAQ